MADMSVISAIQREIREDMSPYFTNDDIIYYLEKNGGDVRATIYELLIIKSEDSSLSLSGINTTDTSGYFKRLASKYKTFNSQNLIGG